MNDDKIKFSIKEKISLINQYKILSKLYPEEESHYQELISIIENGYSIFYSQFKDWISDDLPEDECKFVLNILNLYRAIEDTKRKNKNSSLAQHSYSYFQGFDGNEESEYLGFAYFLIKTQGKFAEQQDYLTENDNLNSHCPMKEKYERMLEKWKEYPKLFSLTPEQVIEILDS